MHERDIVISPLAYRFSLNLAQTRKSLFAFGNRIETEFWEFSDNE